MRKWLKFSFCECSMKFSFCECSIGNGKVFILCVQWWSFQCSVVKSSFYKCFHFVSVQWENGRSFHFLCVCSVGEWGFQFVSTREIDWSFNFASVQWENGWSFHFVSIQWWSFPFVLSGRMAKFSFCDCSVGEYWSFHFVSVQWENGKVFILWVFSGKFVKFSICEHSVGDGVFILWVFSGKKWSFRFVSDQWKMVKFSFCDKCSMGKWQSFHFVSVQCESAYAAPSDYLDLWWLISIRPSRTN